jgi:Tfp pilus assembly protein PilO
MSEPTPSTRRAVNSDRIRAGLRKLNFARDQQVFGPAEVIGLAGSLVILLLVVVSYLYFLMPAKSRLEALQSERSLLRTQLLSSEEVVTRGETTQVAVEKITESLNFFENQGLLGADRGRMGLYDSLNATIRKNGLRNTSGPTYAPLEAAASKRGATGAKTTTTRWQSIYPGIAISVTVEGQYQNLRHFIRDLEMNKQLVIINSVELERSTETNNLPLEGEQSGASRPAIVSLRLEMSTYFQRSSVADNETNGVAR